MCTLGPTPIGPIARKPSLAHTPNPFQTIPRPQIADQCTCFQVSSSAGSTVMSHLGRPTLKPHPRAMVGERLPVLGLKISLGPGLCDRQISDL